MELGRNLSHGVPIATPVFDGAKEADIEEMLKLAGLDASGQSTVFDGRTGDTFDRKVTVGVHLHAQAAPSGGRQDPRAFDRTLPRSLPSSRWAARRSSVASVSAKWKCGRSRLTARRTRSRKC
ncbi:MAG: hypothetical protein WDN50_19760 [Bradyrhizobium sp.]